MLTNAPIRGYQFDKAGIQKIEVGPLLKKHIYRFKTEKTTEYFVYAEHYTYDVFVVKFCLKNHKTWPQRYNVLTDEFDARKIIYTCVNIGLDILRTNPKSSFGFIGMPTPPELLRTNKYFNTKRNRVYLRFANQFYSPDNFTHHLSTDYSACLLVNKIAEVEMPDIKDRVIKMLNDYHVTDIIFE